MKKEKLFRLKACTILTGLLFLACLTAGSASANYVTSLDFSTDDDWVQENTITGTDISSGKIKLHSETNAIPLGGGVGGGAGSKSYTAPNGTTVISSAPVYNNGINYYMGYLFDNQWLETSPESGWVSGYDYWLTSSSGNQTLIITLPSVQNIESVKVYPYSRPDGWSTYKIEVSADNTNWTDITGGFTHTSKGAPEDNFTYQVNNAIKYTKFTLTQEAGWGVTLSEIEMYLTSDEPYSTSQPYYVTTADGSQIDTSLWDTIDSVTTTESTPTDTSLKYLVSFDGKNTWKYWTGSAWANSSLDDLQTNGMSKTTVETINGSQWASAPGFVTGTLDFAIDLNTTNSDYTPELDGIDINYSTQSYEYVCAGLDSLDLGYSQAEKEALFQLYKNGKFDLDPDNVIINDSEWQYYANEFLPGEDPENPFDIGYSYVYNGMNFIKLGSGIGQPLGNAVPELPAGVIPLLGVILSFGLRRLKHSHK